MRKRGNGSALLHTWPGGTAKELTRIRPGQITGFLGLYREFRATRPTPKSPGDGVGPGVDLEGAGLWESLVVEAAGAGYDSEIRSISFQHLQGQLSPRPGAPAFRRHPCPLTALWVIDCRKAFMRSYHRKYKRNKAGRNCPECQQPIPQGSTARCHPECVKERQKGQHKEYRQEVRNGGRVWTVNWYDAVGKGNSHESSNKSGNGIS